MSIVPNFAYFSKALSYSAHQKNLNKYIAKNKHKVPILWAFMAVIKIVFNFCILIILYY